LLRQVNARSYDTMELLFREEGLGSVRIMVDEGLMIDREVNGRITLK
jgi:hypothetical protein